MLSQRRVTDEAREISYVNGGNEVKLSNDNSIIKIIRN
jgi:hypothetical protein